VGVVNGTLLALVGIVALAALLRLYSLRRRPGDPVARALFLGLVWFDAALALGFPPFYWFGYRLLGRVPSLPLLIQDAATMVTAYYMQVFTLHIVARLGETPPRLRRRRAGLLAGLVALAVCYLLGPYRLGLPILAATGDRGVGVAAYVVVIQLYVCAAVLDILRLCWANRGIAPGFLRTGLRLCAVGCAFALLYSLHKMSYEIAAALGTTPPWAESGGSGVQLLALGPAIVCIVTGVTIPFWGPRTARWWRRRRAYHDLRPLAAVARAAEAVPPRPRGGRARLLHRVIHIRDLLVGPLRPHLNGHVYAAARERALQAGQPAAEARAIAEAACIATALRDRGAAPDEPYPPPPMFLGADLDAEAAWLARVSRAYARSPLVHAESPLRRTGWGG
jgi:hypothetical protein